MKIAVTGAGGHIGNVLCRALSANNHHVKALVNSDDKPVKNIGLEIVPGDLFNADSLDRLMNEVDAVVHLAAVVSIGHVPRDFVEHVNVNGTQAVIDAALRNGVRRLYHVSSVHAHASPGFEATIDENTPYALADRYRGYDRSKALGEQAVLQARERGLETTVFNPTAVIGPYDYKPGLTGKMILQLYRGRIPALTPLGYDWVDVRDVAEAIVFAVEHQVVNEKFMLSGEYAPVKEVAELVAIHSGKPAPKYTAPFWLARVGIPFVTLQSKFTRQVPLYTSDALKAIKEGCRNIDCSRARQLLKYRVRPLHDSVSDAIAWFREQLLIK